MTCCFIRSNALCNLCWSNLAYSPYDWSSCFIGIYITSTGKRAWQPNIRKIKWCVTYGGLNTAVISHTNWSYMMFPVKWMVFSMLSKVQLNLLTSPSPLGWYGVVRVLWMFNSLHSSVIICASNCWPWSEWSCSGTPNHEKTSSTNFVATVLASWLGRGNTSTQRVKYRIYPYRSPGVYFL